MVRYLVVGSRVPPIPKGVGAPHVHLVDVKEGRFESIGAVDWTADYGGEDIAKAIVERLGPSLSIAVEPIKRLLLQAPREGFVLTHYEVACIIARAVAEWAESLKPPAEVEQEAPKAEEVKEASKEAPPAEAKKEAPPAEAAKETPKAEPEKAPPSPERAALSGREWWERYPPRE